MIAYLGDGERLEGPASSLLAPDMEHLGGPEWGTEHADEFETWRPR